MSFWLWIFAGLVVFLFYKLIQFIKADGDFTVLSSQLKKDYFKGRVVWVTGASSGIGKKLCYLLSEMGAKVILSARSEDKLATIKDSLAAPENARVLSVDLSDPEATRSIAKKAKELFGRIDILINNAGISTREKFIPTQEKVMRHIMEVNLFAPWILTHDVIPDMISQGFGHIVNVSSLAGKLGAINRTCYSASKFGINGMMDSLRLEMTDTNVHVSNVCPGPVRTAVSENALLHDGSRHGVTDDLIANGMSAKRCAELTLVAVSNQQNEVWISRQPYLTMPYVAHYAPGLLYGILSNKALNNRFDKRQQVEDK